MKVQIEAQPVVYLSSATLFVCHFLEHLLHDRRTFWIYSNPAFAIHQFLVEVPKWCHARPESHFNSCPQPSLHIDAPVVVLKFCRTSENHQEELLVRVIPKTLSIGAYLVELSCIHQIHDLPQVSGVS